MKKEFSKLANFIKTKWKWKKIYYLANAWNYWDGLIREWTIKFFNDYWIKYKEITNKYFKLKYLFTSNNSLFIYWWGWWWCNLWNHSLNYVQFISKKNTVIVLPSSYQQKYPNIKNVYYFSRDKFTSMKNMPKSIFCHDMAFYLWKIINNNKIKFNEWFFYRTDKESSNKILIPENNIDLSLNWNHLSPINEFINEISKYKKIYTDRLHIAICWILLWKDVYIYNSNYFKIYDIYKSSIKPFYENVKFKTYE
jgi:hypothetical protein